MYFAKLRMRAARAAWFEATFHTYRAVGPLALGMTVAVITLFDQAAAEMRTWSDATGKFSVEAELLSVAGDKVVLKTMAGKEVTVSLKRLSHADRAVAREHAEANEPKNSNSAPTSKETAKQLRDLADEFFKDLRNEDREQARAMLTAKAQAASEGKTSALALLPTPDKAASAIRSGKVKVTDDEAEVAVQVRVAGTAHKTVLHLRKAEESWRVFALSAEIAGTSKTMNFEEELKAPGARKDPLADLVGQPVMLTGLTPDGRSVSLAQLKGKVVLIDFWATWCGPCLAEMPNVLANWQKYHEAGFEVIAVSVDRDMEALSKFMTEQNPPWTVVADNHPNNRTSMAGQFGVSGIPAFVLVDREGIVAAVHCRGPRLEQELVKLLGKN